MSRKTEEYLPRKEIVRKKVSIEAHTSNGRVERAIRTIREALVKLDKDRTIKERLKEVGMSYNNTWHAGIKTTAYKAFDKEEEVSQINRDDSKYAKTFKFRERAILRRRTSEDSKAWKVRRQTEEPERKIL